MRLGRWTLSAGLRWDHYHLVVDRNAKSPAWNRLVLAPGGFGAACFL